MPGLGQSFELAQPGVHKLIDNLQQQQPSPTQPSAVQWLPAFQLSARISSTRSSFVGALTTSTQGQDLTMLVVVGCSETATHVTRNRTASGQDLPQNRVQTQSHHLVLFHVF